MKARRLPAVMPMDDARGMPCPDFYHHQCSAAARAASTGRPCFVHRPLLSRRGSRMQSRYQWPSKLHVPTC